MLEVVFDSWLFDICLVWKVFINIPFHMGAHVSPRSPSKNSKMRAYGIEANWMVTLFCPPWRISDLHTKSLFEKGDLVGFWTWMEWDFGTLPMIERSRINFCIKIIYNSINIHHWTKTQNVIHTWHYEPIY